MVSLVSEQHAVTDLPCQKPAGNVRLGETTDDDEDGER